MRRTAVAIVVVLSLGASLVLVCDQATYRSQFSRPFPESARLVHRLRDQAGFDTSFAFCFEVEDDRLLNQLIEDWQLAEVMHKTQDSMSFVALDPPSWWPSQQQLNAMPQRFERVDHVNERYWSVWVDQSGQRLYAECGGW